MIDELVEDLKRSLLGDSASSDDLVALLDLAARVGLCRNDIVKDLGAVVRQRIFSQLVGNVRRDLNFRDLESFARRRLLDLTSRQVTDAGRPAPYISATLVRSLAELQSFIAGARDEFRREGLHLLDESSAINLMGKQGFRCAVCGVPLRENARRQSSRFPEGVEPLATPTLEHRVPFYLVGNRSSYELLCLACNNVKNDRLGVQEDGFVLCGNALRPHDGARIDRRTALWSLYKTRSCEVPDCLMTPAESLMFVTRREPKDPFVYGNVSCFCEAHAPVESWWLHHDFH